MRNFPDDYLDNCKSVPYNEVNLSMKEVFRLFDTYSVAIRSTYMDEKHGKMPVSYDTLYDALKDESRHGSIWLHSNEKVFRLHPYDEAIGIMDIMKELD